MIKVPITRILELLKSLYLKDIRQVKIVRQKCFPFQSYNLHSNSSPFLALVAKCNIRKVPAVVIHILDINSFRVIKSVVKNLESQEDEIRSIEFHKAINIWIDRPGKYDNYKFKTYIVNLSMDEFYPTEQTRLINQLKKDILDRTSSATRLQDLRSVIGEDIFYVDNNA